MAKDVDILWSEFKTHCVEVISNSDSAIRTYLDTCLPVSMKDGVFVIDVPTPFAKEQIKSRFLNKMNDLLVETGFGTSIEIEVSQEIKEDVGAAGRAVAAASPAKISLSRNGLNPNYVFSSFVVGKSNRLPHAACLAVAESPGVAYNPLFIWERLDLGRRI